MSTTRRTAAREQLLGAVQLFIPAVPFGLVLGVAIAESPIDNLLGWSSSWIIFGGASQLTLISLLASGAAPMSAAGAALAVNSRHLMYSAALAERFSVQPRWFRWFAPYLLIDQQFALVDTNEDPPELWRFRYLVSGLTFWTFWQVVVAVGIFTGPIIPGSWGLEFTVPLMFLGLVVVGLQGRPAVAAALGGLLGATAFAWLPQRLGLLVGGLIGVIAGSLADRSDDPGEVDDALEPVS